MVRGALIAAAFLLFPAAASADQSRIAFGSGGDIVVVNADGSGRATLFHQPGRRAADVVWSPDATRFAMTVDRRDTGNARIYTMRADGTGVAQLTPRGSRTTVEFGPRWSPDGTRIAFVRWRFGSSKLITSVVTIGADGTGARTVARLRSRPFAGIVDVTWSPDGTRLLYSRAVRDTHDVYRPSIWSIAAAGGDRRLVARDAAIPSFSPDGTKIAYQGLEAEGRRTICDDENGCTPRGDIYVSNADGSAAQRLTGGGSDDRSPAWSPDGFRIVFSSDRNYPGGDDADELYSIEPDGACLTWLTNGTPSSEFPAWEPGAGKTSDPGGCGATPRPPFVGVDLSAALAFNRAPTYWVGPVAPDGALLSNADAGREGVRLDYADCGAFDASACPTTTFSTYSRPACDAGLGGYSLNPAELVIFRGALVSRDPALTVIWTGGTEIEIEDPGRARLDALLGQLRPVTDETPPDTLPAPALPRELWGFLDRLAKLHDHGASTRALARRFQMAPSRVRLLLSLRRKLVQLGVGRLAC